jgi:hypothetical protein
MVNYVFTISPCAIDRLTQEIQMSSIATPLDHIDAYGSTVTIWFSQVLSGTDQNTLSSIAAAHTGIPLSVTFNEMSSNVTTSSNSSSYVVLNGMQSPALPAGKYLILFSGTFSTTIPLLANPAIYVACFTNGAIVPVTEQNESNTVTGNVFNISFQCRVTLGPNQVVDVRWKNNGVLNTVSCFSRVLDVMAI